MNIAKELLVEMMTSFTLDFSGIKEENGHYNSFQQLLSNAYEELTIKELEDLVEARAV